MECIRLLFNTLVKCRSSLATNTECDKCLLTSCSHHNSFLALLPRSLVHFNRTLGTLNACYRTTNNNNNNEWKGRSVKQKNDNKINEKITSIHSRGKYEQKTESSTHSNAADFLWTVYCRRCYLFLSALLLSEPLVNFDSNLMNSVWPCIQFLLRTQPTTLKQRN